FAADAHVAARGFFVPAERPYLGSHLLPGAPYHFSEAGWSLRRPAPLLGQHTAELLAEIAESALSPWERAGGEGASPSSPLSNRRHPDPLPRGEGEGGPRSPETPLAGVRV